MGVLLSVSDLGHAFGARPLFEGLTFSISDGEKIALIGANGAGKSTLLKLLAGEFAPDSGTIARTRGLKVGHLPQVPTFRPGITVREAIYESVHEGEDWSAVSAAEESISRLGIRTVEGSLEERPVAELSGGWQKKVALARELARNPDLLLLDEPTNHLDLDSILWLESWIRASSLSILTISHDREFLRKVANRTLEVDRRNPNGIFSVSGGYDAFLQVKEEYLENLAAREAALSNTLRRETEWLRRGAKARTTKQKARIDRALDLQSEVADLRDKNRNREAKLEFSTQEQGPKKLVEAKGIGKGYGGKSLFSGLDLLIRPHTRLGLLGKNGAGKSTLIRVLTGDVPPDQGTVIRNDRLKVAYFEQNRDRLDPSKTLLRTVCPSGETVEFQGRKLHVRSYLDRFLFDQQQMDMEVGKLSGGEQSRLLLALLMLEPANLLVLDEPTNDLDLPTLALLEECLEDFDGAVILVSHDRAFMDAVCNQILAFPEMIAFSDLDQWSSWRLKSQAEAAALARGPTASREAAPRSEPQKRKLSYKEQREFDLMESVILENEEKLAALQAKSVEAEYLQSPSRLRELMTEIASTQTEIDRLYERWGELERQGATKST